MILRLPVSRNDLSRQSKGGYRGEGGSSEPSQRGGDRGGGGRREEGGGRGAGFELVSQKRRAMLAMEFVPDGSALLDDH